MLNSDGDNFTRLSYFIAMTYMALSVWTVCTRGPVNGFTLNCLEQFGFEPTSLHKWDLSVRVKTP